MNGGRLVKLQPVIEVMFGATERAEEVRLVVLGQVVCHV